MAAYDSLKVKQTMTFENLAAQGRLMLNTDKC